MPQESLSISIGECIATFTDPQSGDSISFAGDTMYNEDELLGEITMKTERGERFLAADGTRDVVIQSLPRAGSRDVTFLQGTDLDKLVSWSQLRIQKIFDLFANKFANLYKIKGVKHTNLKGYTYNPKTNFFTLKNIPEDIFDKIYKDILNRGNNTKQSNEIFIIDWKYYSHTLFDNPLYRDNDRINQSIIKSLLYEFCLSQITTDLVINQFGIPYYDLENNEIVMSMEKLDSGIQLVRMNFLKIQEIYLND